MRLYFAEVSAAIRVSLSDRADFALQSCGMVLNNGFVLLMWFMFFAGFRAVAGWRLADMALQIGILAVVFGSAGVFAGGYRDMAAAVLRGDLDAMLTQPKPILPRLLAQESSAPAWGDITVGSGLLIFAAAVPLRAVPALCFALVASFAVYLATAILFASLAFWVRGARSFARDLVEFILLFGTWPGSIWTGATRVLIYTVIPAGFVTMLPVRFLRQPSLQDGAVLSTAAVVYSLLALVIFRTGLRRYSR